MSLSPGTRLGSYEITGAIGAGGMGEVYRARDTRLDRTVAIKRLPPALASDPDARSRFEREARAIAALNDPHICTLYDVGRDEQSDYLVMELVEGETLASRLERGRLPLEQVLSIGEQIARALDRAHRRGIVHRDLKPSNVMIVRGASAMPHVKLLDFGLARLVGRAAVSFTQTADMTVAAQTPLTGSGAILGTLNYMSPEQVEGKEADHRADIFALGCVLYEMVTGRRAFSGDSPASTMAAIIERQPAPISDVQAVAPAWLDLVIRTALAKDPDERWQSAADVAANLRELPGLWAPPAPARARQPFLPTKFVAVALAALAIGSAATWLWTSRNAGGPLSPLARLTLPIAPATSLSNTLVLGILAVAPAGDLVAYVGTGNGMRSLFVRRLDQPAATPIPNTSSVGGPFFSPDGRWLGYQTAGAGASLVKMLLATGAVTTICPLPSQMRGAVWGRDGTIIFGSGAGPLYRVSADGGTPQPLAPLRPGEHAHRSPALLPDGEHVLFASGGATIRWDAADLEVQNIRTASRRSLGIKGMQPRFVPPGRLVFARDPQLMAVAFDPRSMTVSGAATPVEDDVSNVWAVGVAHYAVSDSGMLVFIRESLVGDGLSMARLTAGGAVAQTLPVPKRLYADPVVAPNGRVVAVEDYDAADDIWVIDLQTGAPQRLTFSENEDETPVWSPDGVWVAYASDRSSGRQILRRRADGGGAEEILWTGKTHLHVDDWTGDGRYLVTSGVDGTALALLDLAAKPRALRPLKSDGKSISSARLSRDGRWIAYTSAESGSEEVWVQDFPQLSARWQVSRDGGINPMWAPDGRAIFYNRGATLYRVPVQPMAGALSFSPAAAVFPSLTGVKGNHRSWTVLPDGGVLVLHNESANQVPSLSVFLNWAASLLGDAR